MLINNIKILPYQKELSQSLPLISGNKDYSEFKKIIKRIDEILTKSDIEKIYMKEYIKESIEKSKNKTEQDDIEITESRQVKMQGDAKQGLRCIIARNLLQQSFRDFSCRLADSPLLQWFCQIDRIDAVKVPSKSTLQRYETVLSEAKIKKMTYELLKEANNNYGNLKLTKPVAIADLFFDLTCVKANIHYPVDWVLLRDATITLMKAVKLIRKYGLRNRMEAPESFIKEINKLSIKMTHSQYKPGSKKYRKNILRLMKRLLKKIEKHAGKHRELLKKEWKNTILTENQKDLIIRRIDSVIEQLPLAVRQAHERIIGERQVANEEKILSLYEPDVHVIVRGKSGARVEFGNTLFIAEQRDGLIVDWELYKNQAPADCKTVIPGIERVNENYAQKINSITGDRGLWDKENEEYLEKNRIKNNICPRSVRALSIKLKSRPFVIAQLRRAQTEGRIGIIKNCFLGRPLRSKGFANRKKSVAYAVLTHNLWLLARLPDTNIIEEFKVAI